MQMQEIIEIKRKEFVIIEKINEHSFKVERKGKHFFLKKYDNKDQLREFIEKSHRLKLTAMDVPKVYMFDKNLLISVVDFIEGPTMLDVLSKEDIKDETILKILLQDEWYMRREKLRIDFSPENFKYDGKKLYYLPYKYGSFESDYNFVMKDFKLWFPTKELANYVESKGLTFDRKRIGNEYATNKQIALLTVKYYM